MSRRPSPAGLVALACTALAAGLIVAALAGLLDDDRPPPAPVEVVPGTPAWGEFPGSPPPLEVPPGGEVRPTAAGALEVRRDDGTLFAVVDTGAVGEVVGVRYHDARGRATVAIDRVAAPPTRAVAARLAAARARPRCVDRRRASGWRWRSPVPWRANLASTPRGLRRADALAAMRSARVTWIRNRNRCGEPDASRATFRYRGATRRPVGRNGVSSIGFGEVDALGGACVGAVACTVTFLRGTTAIESDVRLDRNPRRRFTVVPRGSGFDLESVLVHETGHTLGFDHVDSPANVMNPYLAAGDRTGRRIGRGDARINNSRY